MSRCFAYLASTLMALPALAQADLADLSCDDSARMTQTLQDVIGAQRQGLGLRDPETILEVWVTARTGDFLIVQSYSNGTSCIVALGAHWEGELPTPAQG